MESGSVSGRVRAGLFEIDLDSGELYRGGRKVALQEQPFRVLAVLLDRPGEVVTRQNLQSRVWPADTYVGFDEGLNTAIRKLRAAFGDSAENPRFIETVPRRGYRFIAPVISVVPDAVVSTPTDAVTSASAQSPRLPAWSLVAALFLVFLIAMAIPRTRRIVRDFVFGSARADTSAPIHSLAVLPLENLSNDAAQDYFADGMTDQLITDLGQIKALRVISRTSVMQYKGLHKPIPQIARELNVDAVVEGTILKSGNQVRITAQLIQAALDKHLWAQSYQGDLHDVLSLQNNVAGTIAREIQVTITPREQALLKSGRTVNPQAYDDYLLGRYFWNKRDGGGLQKAADYFQQAIRTDPSYAPAYAGLAQTDILLAYNLGPKAEFLAAGKKAAGQALTLDPSLAEAHTARAMLLESEYDFAQEEQEFKLAVSLDPNYATAHHWYGESYLAQIGRFDEANSEMQQALVLDPVSRIIATDQGVLLYWERKYDDAYQQLTKTLALDSGFSEAYLCRGKVLLQQGKYKDAMADLETAYRINPANPAIPTNLAYGYALAGNRTKAESKLHSLLSTSKKNSWAIGLIYLGLGDKEQSLDWLERAVREYSGDMIDVRVEPQFDSLRGEPRFKELQLKMKLPN
jgi:TolB-like protein/DNA-binding winged helix-turn-helix (wHTH) protein/Tfp pilus assembly protein PilF